MSSFLNLGIWLNDFALSIGNGINGRKIRGGGAVNERGF